MILRRMPRHHPIAGERLGTACAGLLIAARENPTSPESCGGHQSGSYYYGVFVKSVMLAVAFAAFAGGVVPTKGTEKPVDCTSHLVPRQVEDTLRVQFGSWKIQDLDNLSSNARASWEAEKASGCPGVAVGQFEGTESASYAVFLVPAERPETSYKLVIFTRANRQPFYHMRVVEQSARGGARNFFIRTANVGKFFDGASRKKFHVWTKDCILQVDSGKDEYEADVYFWAEGAYRHEPVDY